MQQGPSKIQTRIHGTHPHPTNHIDTSKLLALEKHCLVIGQKLHLHPVQRGAGTAELSDLLQPRCLHRKLCCQSGMQEDKQGYKALSISLMHSGHPRQSGGSTGGWGPWCAESRAPWVPGSQCGESKELMKMLGNTLLCIRLRTKLQKPHLLENWGMPSALGLASLSLQLVIWICYFALEKIYNIKPSNDNCAR